MNTHTLTAHFRREYQDVPAIHAAVVISLFFCVAFLNYGWMLAVLASHVGAVFIFLRRKKALVRLPVALHLVSLEAAALLLGLCAYLAFQAWKPVLPSFAPLARTSLWLLFAAVLIGTKFTLLSRVLAAWTEPKWFSLQMKSIRPVFVALILLILAVLLFLAAQLGPDANRMPEFLMRELVPGLA